LYYVKAGWKQSAFFIGVVVSPIEELNKDLFHFTMYVGTLNVYSFLWLISCNAAAG
jgi:hypothetical protein